MHYQFENGTIHYNLAVSLVMEETGVPRENHRPLASH
jgi:hypothetical protein